MPICDREELREKRFLLFGLLFWFWMRGLPYSVLFFN